MSTLDEQLQYGISQFKKVPNIVDVQVEEPSNLINLQIDNVPSKVFVLTVSTYVSTTQAIIKFVVPIDIIMMGGPINIPSFTIDSLAYNLVIRPFDNSIQDHTFSDNLTDTSFTLYIDPTPDTPNPKLFRPILLRGVSIKEYQGGPDYDELINLIKQQPYVKNVYGNLVIDPNIMPVEGKTFIAFSIETTIPLKNALLIPPRPCIMTDTISCMVIFDIDELNFHDIVVRHINERLDEYRQFV